MASLGLTDMMSRSMDAPKKKNWVKAAVPKERRGIFKKKAEEAGESTREFAREKAGAPGKLGREARLATTLMGMSHKRKKKSVLYDHPRSERD